MTHTDLDWQTAADAAAICEAATRGHMRFVALKSVDQQSVLALHTVRSGFVKQRTALSNQIRGMLAEFGVVLPQGLSKLAQQLPVVLADQGNELTGVVRELVQMLQMRHKVRIFLCHFSVRLGQHLGNLGISKSRL